MVWMIHEYEMTLDIRMVGSFGNGWRCIEDDIPRHSIVSSLNTIR